MLSTNIKKLQDGYVELSAKLARQEQQLVQHKKLNQSLEKRLQDELEKKVAIKSLDKSLDSIRFSLGSQIALVMKELQAIRGKNESIASATKSKTNVVNADLIQEKLYALKLHNENEKVKLEKICNDLEKRLNAMELINSFSGFFAWRISNFHKFKEHGTLVERSGLFTSFFGFECRLSLYWSHETQRDNATLSFEVVKKTPRTVTYLPFFCDVIVSVISFDGEIISRKISYENLTHLDPVGKQSSQVLCYAEIANFLQFPANNKFINVNNQLCLFGYFKPFEPYTCE